MTMERLTSENSFCFDCDYTDVCKADCNGKKVYDKLKTYEDLGFTPEEIVHMARFFKERTSAEYIANEMRIVAKLLKSEQEEAHWIRHEWAEVCDGCLISNYECSECGNWERENSNYCPDCGCKMTEVT